MDVNPQQVAKVDDLGVLEMDDRVATGMAEGAAGAR
jgi:hypothetical protein